MSDAHQALLDACAAAPDDDAPRLVWADLAGGERGELVVLQCELARGALPPGDAARLRRRERELLAAHAVAWAGPFARWARTWSFHRGFLEAAQLDPPDDGAADPPPVPPLLDSVAIERWASPAGLAAALERIPRLRALALGGLAEPGPRAARVRDSRGREPDAAAARRGARRVLEQLGDRGTALRALGVATVPSEIAELVRATIAAAPIERLRLGLHPRGAAGLVELLDAAPRLAALELELDDATDVAAVIEPIAGRALRALRLAAVDADGFARLCRSPAAARLEHLELGLGGAPLPPSAVALPRLRSLAVRSQGAGLVAALVGCDLPRLRVLRLAGAPARDDVDALVARFGAQLELLELPGALADGIADDARGALAGRLARLPGAGSYVPAELLHRDPGTTGQLGAPDPRHAPPATLAVLAPGPDRRVWQVPPLAQGERFRVGREPSCDVVLDSACVARTHATLAWHAGRLTLVDLHSTSGTLVNDERWDIAELADGDELTFGDMILRCFLGEGAPARAAAALATTAGRDPLTGLPYATPGDTRIRIADAAWLAEVHGSLELDRVLRALAPAVRARARGERVAVCRPHGFAVEHLETAIDLVMAPYEIDTGVRHRITLELDGLVEA